MELSSASMGSGATFFPPAVIKIAFLRPVMMLLAKLNQAAKAEKRGVLVCEGVFSINQSMARVKFIAAAVKTC